LAREFAAVASVVAQAVRYGAGYESWHQYQGGYIMSKVFSSSAGLGSGVGIGTWIYHAFTHGITADTWYRSVFVAAFTFFLAVCILGLKEWLRPVRRGKT
jgi:hypothetical protein